MPEYEELEPRFKEALLTRMRSEASFWTLLGMEIIDVKKGWAMIKVPYSEKLTNANGVAHGGAIFSPADSAVGLALLGLTDRDEYISTIEMKINYMRPFSGGDIYAEAKIVHRGSNTAVGDVEVRDGNENLIARGLATYIIIKKE